MTTPIPMGGVLAGKYRIERVLGQGGMGVVVVARHLRLGERVAIKFPVARLAARDEVVARWVREGRAAMRIRSQHVARVFDVGTLETGEPYLVMEYLVGRDLAAVLADQGPLASEDAIEHVLQATEALAEAHAQGIIHRDLKPSNLFLTRGADGSALTKVLDFGTAKTMTLSPETSLTGLAAVIGTPLFMAPEQMRSDREIDARADIWALGATLHTLLAGAPPFSAGSIVELYESILLGAPPLRTLRPDAPFALEAILLRCMQAEPRNRYASVAQLAEALAEVAPEPARISAARVARILSAAPLATETTDVSTGECDFAETAAPAPQTTASAAKASWLEVGAAGTPGTGMGSLAPQSAATPKRWTPASRSVVVLALAGTLAAAVIEVSVRARGPGPRSARASETAMPGPGAPSTGKPLEPFMFSAALFQPLPAPSAVSSEGDAGGVLASKSRAPAHSKSTERVPVMNSPRSAALADTAGPSPVRPQVRDPLADPD